MPRIRGSRNAACGKRPAAALNPAHSSAISSRCSSSVRRSVWRSALVDQRILLRRRVDAERDLGPAEDRLALGLAQLVGIVDVVGNRVVELDPRAPGRGQRGRRLRPRRRARRRGVRRAGRGTRRRGASAGGSRRVPRLCARRRRRPHGRRAAPRRGTSTNPRAPRRGRCARAARARRSRRRLPSWLRP